MNTCLQNCKVGDHIVCESGTYVVSIGFDSNDRVTVEDAKGNYAGYFQPCHIKLISKIIKKPLK